MEWQDRLSPRIHIVFSGRNEAPWTEPGRRLYDHELVFVSHGACRIIVRDRSVLCESGHFVIVPPDTLHSTHQISPSLHRYCIHFDWTGSSRPPPPGIGVFHPGRMDPALVHKAPAFIPGSLMHGKTSPLSGVRDLLDDLVRCWRSGDAGQRAACRGLLLSVLLLLLTPAETAHRSLRPSLASVVRDRLHQPLSQRQSVQHELEKLGYSYAHLARLFHQAYGISPLQYLNALRIEQAKRLLVNPELSVEAVARQAGVNNPQYFARMFRRYTGKSPSQYRQETC